MKHKKKNNIQFSCKYYNFNDDLAIHEAGFIQTLHKILHLMR